MPSNDDLMAALAALRQAMQAESDSWVAFMNEHSAANKTVWTTARVQADLAWGRLWELKDPDRTQEAPRMRGEEWAKDLRASMERQH